MSRSSPLTFKLHLFYWFPCKSDQEATLISMAPMLPTGRNFEVVHSCGDICIIRSFLTTTRINHGRQPSFHPLRPLTSPQPQHCECHSSSLQALTTLQAKVTSDRPRRHAVVSFNFNELCARYVDGCASIHLSTLFSPRPPSRDTHNTSTSTTDQDRPGTVGRRVRCVPISNLPNCPKGRQ